MENVWKNQVKIICEAIVLKHNGQNEQAAPRKTL